MMFRKAFFGLFYVSLFIPSSAIANDGLLAAEKLNEIFVERCANRILDEKTVNGWLMKRLPQETAKSLNWASTGRAWVARDTYVTLNEVRSPNGQSYGCVTEWSSASRGRQVIDFEAAIDIFNNWANSEIARGSLLQTKECGNTSTEYTRVLESRKNPEWEDRIVLSYVKDLDFLFLMAAESGERRNPAPCD